MTNIKLTPVSGSSLIAADGWDTTHTTLAVEFVTAPGKVYEFRGLSPAIHDAYESAASKGKYLKGTIERYVKGVGVLA